MKYISPSICGLFTHTCTFFVCCILHFRAINYIKTKSEHKVGDVCENVCVWCVDGEYT